MTVMQTKATALLDSASEAVERAHTRYRTNAASHHRLLETLGSTELGVLMEASLWMTAEEGDVLATQGDAVEWVAFITTGNAREEVADPEKGAFRAVVNFLSAGDDIGLLSLMDRAPHQSSVIAMRRIQALQVPMDLAERYLAAHPEWYQSIAAVAVSRFRASSLWLQALV
jgi:CRP-like cAMP-binding protein